MSSLRKEHRKWMDGWMNECMYLGHTKKIVVLFHYSSSFGLSEGFQAGRVRFRVRVSPVKPGMLPLVNTFLMLMHLKQHRAALLTCIQLEFNQWLWHALYLCTIFFHFLQKYICGCNLKPTSWCIWWSCAITAVGYFSSLQEPSVLAGPPSPVTDCWARGNIRSSRTTATMAVFLADLP